MAIAKTLNCKKGHLQINYFAITELLFLKIIENLMLIL